VTATGRRVGPDASDGPAGDAEARWTAYFVPGSTVLTNKPGLTAQADLDRFERLATARRADELAGASVPLTPSGYRALHRHLFQDVYAWAGDLRDVPLAKGTTQFEAPAALQGGLAAAFAKLGDTGLRGLDADAFAARAGDLLADLNRLHPFREGNGRAQRALVAQLGREAGHPVSFRSISAARMVAASIAADGGRYARPSTEGLRAIVREAIDTEALAKFDALAPTLAALKASGDFDWHKADVAVLRPGERAEGTAALARSGVFALRVGDRLLIGSLAADAALPDPGTRIVHVEPNARAAETRTARARAILTAAAERGQGRGLGE
jgi:cell filamentation protein